MNKDIQRLFILLGFIGCILPCLASDSPSKETKKVSNNNNLIFLTSFIDKTLFIEASENETPSLLDKIKSRLKAKPTGTKQYRIRNESLFLNSHPIFTVVLTAHFQKLKASLDHPFNAENPDDIFALKQHMADAFMPLFDDNGKDRVLSPDELTINSEKLAIFFELTEVGPNGSRTTNEVVDKLIAGPHRPMYNKKNSPGDYWILIPFVARALWQAGGPKELECQRIHPLRKKKKKKKMMMTLAVANKINPRQTTKTQKVAI